MDKLLYIFGCGGHARSIISVIQRNNLFQKIVLVDSQCKKDEIILSCKTISEDEFFEKKEKSFSCIIGIGDNFRRTEYVKKLENVGGNFVNIIANSAVISDSVKIGKSVYVADMSFLGPEVIIGNNTIINTATVVEHECRIGNNVHIAPNTTICGRTEIGDNCFIGAGSVVKDQIKIIDNVIVGAGSIVIKDLLSPGTYVGCPARKVN